MDKLRPDRPPGNCCDPRLWADGHQALHRVRGVEHGHDFQRRAGPNPEIRKDTRRSSKPAIPFNIPVGLPARDPFVRKQLLFRAGTRTGRPPSKRSVKGSCSAISATSWNEMENFSRRGQDPALPDNPFKKTVRGGAEGTFGKAGIERVTRGRFHGSNARSCPSADVRRAHHESRPRDHFTST